jgi:hypothetical protein
VAKPDSTQATETLHEIESIFDRAARWSADHPLALLGVLAAILFTAAGIGGYQAWERSREAGASAELAAIESEYLQAMGAAPGQLEVPEPANAEAAAATRREYAARLLDGADRHAGSRAAVGARLRAGALLAELGDAAAAQAAWRAAAEGAPSGSALAALAQLRLATAFEDAGDFRAAAEAYLAAGQVDAFPGRVLALGDAARCFAEAGDTARALEVFGRLGEEEAAELPAHVSSRLRELAAASARAASAPASAGAPGGR